MKKTILMVSLLALFGANAYAEDSASLSEEAVNSDLSALGGNDRNTQANWPKKWAGGVTAGGSVALSGTKMATSFSQVVMSSDGQSGVIYGLKDSYGSYGNVGFSYNGNYAYSGKISRGSLSITVTENSVSIGTPGMSGGYATNIATGPWVK